MPTALPEEPRCPVCAAARTVAFLHRPAVPVHQHLLHTDPGAARAIARGTLAMRACPECDFVFNAGFDARLLDYGQDYDNTQTCSAAFDQYLDGLVRELVEVHGVRGCRVVEVGCGKGTFLKKLVAWQGAGNLGFGFDPSYLGPEVALEGRLRFYRRFYDEQAAGLAADVVVCRHVIEHVPDPVGLVRLIRSALGSSSRARVFLETPCVEWILRHQVLWDWFYEHCSLFTDASLARAVTLGGFDVVAVRHVFAGQYLWLEGMVASGQIDRRAAGAAGRVLKLAAGLSLREQAQVAAWRAELRRRQRLGPVAVWGAGAKGVTFCNLADPECELISCVVDVNPAKQGKYIAGTGHSIVAPEAVKDVGVVAALVLNPNYVGEIADHLARHGSPPAAVDLMRAG